tara:strand:+ start:100528 stop:101520 length:993 start_codon:yes stop_codon:yes gene_type:complete
VVSSPLFLYSGQNGTILNSQLTAEVAALIASQSLSLAEGTKPFSPTALYDFWFHGQEHLKQRRNVLEPFANEDENSQISEKELEVILKDFFAEEMLVRVVTAVFTAADKRRNQCQAEPIARSLFLSFLDVKRLALSILVSEKHISLDALKSINRIRRSIERWTDLFLGQLVFRFGLEEFAHDVARSKDFGEDQVSNLNVPHPIQTWDLITAGLRISFPAGLSSKTDDHWEKMLGAIIACYPAECFNDSATMKSLQRVRIERSGLHPETTPDRLPEQFNSPMYRSLFGTHSQKQTIHKQPANLKADLSPLNHKTSISFSKLKKRNPNESSS